MDTTIYDWAESAATALELPGELADRAMVQAVLDLARDVAQGAARPAAPVGAFLAGVALGRDGATTPQALEAVRSRLAATLTAQE